MKNAKNWKKNDEKNNCHNFMSPSLCMFKKQQCRLGPGIVSERPESCKRAEKADIG